MLGPGLPFITLWGHRTGHVQPVIAISIPMRGRVPSAPPMRESIAI